MKTLRIWSTFIGKNEVSTSPIVWKGRLNPRNREGGLAFMTSRSNCSPVLENKVKVPEKRAAWVVLPRLIWTKALDRATLSRWTRWARRWREDGRYWETKLETLRVGRLVCRRIS